MYYGELLKPPTSRGSQGAGGVGGLLKVTDKTFTEESWRGSVYYPTYDGNGNVSEYVDADGTVSAHYEQCDSILDRSGATCPKGKNRNNDCFYQYDAFGNVINSKTTGERAGDFKYKFSTKPEDSETGFYYYGYRYYDAVDGRWLNRDPIGERGGYNLYAFIDNKVTSHFDFLGYTTTGGIIGIVNVGKRLPAGNLLVYSTLRMRIGFGCNSDGEVIVPASAVSNLDEEEFSLANSSSDSASDELTWSALSTNGESNNAISVQWSGSIIEGDEDLDSVFEPIGINVPFVPSVLEALFPLFDLVADEEYELSFDFQWIVSCDCKEEDGGIKWYLHIDQGETYGATFSSDLTASFDNIVGRYVIAVDDGTGSSQDDIQWVE